MPALRGGGGGGGGGLQHKGGGILATLGLRREERPAEGGSELCLEVSGSGTQEFSCNAPR